MGANFLGECVGAGSGGEAFLWTATAVCGFVPGSCTIFFLYMDPLTYGGGPGPNSGYPPTPRYGPLPVKIIGVCE